jgi:hypothetical protein
MSEGQPKTQNSRRDPADDVRARFNGELDHESVIAWAEFDLDGQNPVRQTTTPCSPSAT